MNYLQVGKKKSKEKKRNSTRDKENAHPHISHNSSFLMYTRFIVYKEREFFMKTL